MTIVTSPNARPLSSDEAQGIVDTLTGGWSGLAGEAFDLFTDRPGFVASDEPISPLGTAVRALTRLNCRQWARADKGGFSPRINAYNAEVCTPYLDILNETPPPGDLGRDFEGGQCAGVFYRIFLTQRNTSTGEPGVEQLRGSRVGPLVVSTVSPAPTTCGDFVPTPERWIHTAGTEPQSGIALANSGSGSCTRFPWDTRIRLERVDGNPDDCGNPPPRTTPPGVRPDLPPIGPGIQIQLPGYGPVNVEVTLSPEGTVNVSLPDIDAGFNIDLSRGPGGGGGGGSPPGGVGSPATPSDTGQGGQAEGQAADGDVLTGLRVDFAAPPVGGNEYAPGVFRGVCYVYMGTEAGLDHDPAGAMLRDGQFIFAEKENLTRWLVRANTGYNLRVTPYYRSVEG